MRHSSQASLLLPHHGPPSPAFLTLHHISFSVSGSGYPSSPRTQPAQGRAELARSAAGSSIFTLGWGGGWQNSSLTSHSHLWHQAEMWHSQLCICMILCACRELCPRVETAAGVTVWSTSKKLPPATQHRLHQTHLLAARSRSLPVVCTARHLSYKPQGATPSPCTDRSTARLEKHFMNLQNFSLSDSVIPAARNIFLWTMRSLQAADME